MEAIKLHDLAYEYAEEVLKYRSIMKPDELYEDIAQGFKAEGGNKEDYRVFIDVVHMWIKTHVEVQLSDAYINTQNINF